MALLELNDVHTYYGAIHALRGVSLTVDEGEIVTLIGSNGAGKSTTLRTISGLLKPRQGEITPARRADRPAAGRMRSSSWASASAPEGRRVFARMTVHENLEMGAFSRKDKAAIAADFERVYGLFPRLRERETQKAGTLSGGEQQMLAIGRALMSAPKVLLLDEPSMGLAPILVEQIFDIIKDDQRAGDDGPARRAERAHGAGHRQSRLHPPDRRDRARGRGGGPGREPGGPSGLPREGTDRVQLCPIFAGSAVRRPGSTATSVGSWLIVLIGVLVAVVKPWGAAHDGSAAIVAPSRQPDSQPQPDDAVRASPVRHRRVRDPEPPPSWEIWSAGNLASFKFAMRVDISTPVVPASPPVASSAVVPVASGSDIPVVWPIVEIPPGSQLDLIAVNWPLGHTIEVVGLTRDDDGGGGETALRPILGVSPWPDPLHDDRSREWRRHRGDAAVADRHVPSRPVDRSGQDHPLAGDHRRQDRGPHPHRPPPPERRHARDDAGRGPIVTASRTPASESGWRTWILDSDGSRALVGGGSGGLGGAIADGASRRGRRRRAGGPAERPARCSRRPGSMRSRCRPTCPRPDGPRRGGRGGRRRVRRPRPARRQLRRPAARAASRTSTRPPGRPPSTAPCGARSASSGRPCPHLRDGRDPAILVILSSSVREPIPGLTTSNLLRPGLAGLIKSLVEEIVPVRINGLAPGPPRHRPDRPARRRARPDDGRCRSRRSSAAHARAHPAGPLRRPARSSAAWRPSCCRRPPPTSPARSCRSTAG